MLADFYLTRDSNDMKMAVQKNYLGGQFFTEVKTVLYKTASLLQNFIEYY